MNVEDCNIMTFKEYLIANMAYDLKALAMSVDENQDLRELEQLIVKVGLEISRLYPRRQGRKQSEETA